MNTDPTPTPSAILTSEPQHDGGFLPVLQVGCQSFAFGYLTDTKAESDWFCDQMRIALEKAGCRVSQKITQTTTEP